MRYQSVKSAILLLVCLVFAAPAAAQDFGNAEQFAAGSLKNKEYSPYAGRGFPTQVFWGDTHLHTNLSVDAGMFGNRLGLEEAYRFTRGEEVVSSTGVRAKLSRPLDWVVVADHSDGYGMFAKIASGDPELMKNETARRWNRMFNEGGESAVEATLEIIDLFSRGEMPFPINAPESIGPVWEDVLDAAEKYNDPGEFTAFIGYEWTSLAPPGNNLHRVLVYRDAKSRAGQKLPMTTEASIDPEDLWDYMADYEAKTGGKVLAIPHNGNLSNGMMFDVVDMDGNPLTRAYAETRDRWEPVYEVTQIKGDGEAHPLLSPDDEFADHETWNLGNLNLSEAKTEEMLQHEYGRSALKLGLQLEAQLGVNPFQFGMIGSTDSHTSLPTAEEENFFGKHSGGEPSPERASHVSIGAPDGSLAYMGWDMVSSGYAAVWATENTRQAIWDALMRREVYATTGSRMLVRFFGGFEFTEADARSRFPGQAGYSKGVPMGGELAAANGRAPTFLVAALKDPYGGNLDRIQIVKGWLDSGGELQERVYDVAVSDGREIGSDGRAREPVGNTVDVENATWLNTIGDPELISVWQDPEFDASERAFYYARVIEIPTPRWTAYDAFRFGIDMPDEVEMTTQERAYTSPIWYSP
ncbi:MAG: DUF3604 domain-containing protein [marine benthic group bacterium]|nr:DUF3604 domain-containing protein [Candidatus Benthicola marisminoris]